MQKLIRHIIILFILAVAQNGFSQLKTYPIPPAEGESTKPRKGARTHSHTLTLPFWDDFSASTGAPDTNLWQTSENVFINQGLAHHPPTLGVASFDGLDQTGQGYKQDQASVGKTDSLTSHPIDLSALTVAGNVYISFFYQYGGFGENPDSSDSLRLEFKNENGQWVSVWPGSAGLDRTGEFVQAIVQVDDPLFFYDGFQFKFQSFGRQSGPFDVWNVDYVYVNEDRSATDLYYPDRAISTPLTNLFQDYSVVPISHFAFENLSMPQFEAYSLDNPEDTPQPYDYGLNIKITNYSNGMATITTRGNDDIKPEESPLAPLERDIVTIPDYFQDGDIDSNADSTAIEVVVILDAGDNIPISSNGDYIPEKYAPIDFRSNDTTRTSLLLSNYYAYDDGGAESAAGLNSFDDRLVYRYDLIQSMTDTVVALDIYFPYIGTEPTGKVIELLVMAAESGKPGELLHQEMINISRTPGLNSFTRYELRKSVNVTDSFFIGYRQKTSGDLGVGLDKNNDSGDRIYFELDGTWQQNTTVKGSLMMRPVFGPSSGPVTSTDPDKDLSLQVFPNPSNGIFKIKGKFTELKVYDLRGVSKNFSLFFENDEAILSLENQADGIYILQFVNNNSAKTIKVIKQ
ncbi:hypothetical protein C900_00260 [Fulvivirga imtechensis AK7]|uniref:Secretion system C-terminal sorting domain-containing protein n=1 Tax=Fulvivirga imtechensis AK7 TaxID=1237149 RepID=L8JLW4_9BACT|nr:T9SS type A sorting domain-containing protein [Fulvivirga imtechensis]ELR68519.1 hypothetical protein C900_00260 [Fulvivirga imtechensis AK7]